MSLFPLFIVVEGIDGSGKTTLAKNLATALDEDGHMVFLTSEPSKLPVGTYIKQRLDAGMSPRLAALLFAADRVDHVEREIQPALDSGAFVVCSRYTMSSVAYQGTLIDDPLWVDILNHRVRLPDVTLLLDLPAAVAKERRLSRGSGHDVYENDVVLSQVAGAYREMTGAAVHVIDATLPPEEVMSRALAVVKRAAKWKEDHAG